MDIYKIRELVEAARNDCLEKVDETSPLADSFSKMFNCGINKLFYTVLIRLSDAEAEARKGAAKC